MDGNVGEFLKYLPGVDLEYVESEPRGPRAAGHQAFTALTGKCSCRLARKQFRNRWIQPARFAVMVHRLRFAAHQRKR
jgi:hypothetical protein